MNTPHQKANISLPYAFRELGDPRFRNHVYHSGRGAAKSHTFAYKLVLLGREHKLRIFCGRELQNSISESVKQLLEDKIDELNLSYFYTSTQKHIIGANGTKFAFGGLKNNPSGLKSFEGIDIAWLEEASSISQKSLTDFTNTVRKPGSQIWYSFNRYQTSDPVDQMFLSPHGPPPRTLIRKVSWRDNPWFPDVLREQLEYDRGRDYDYYMHVWEGEPLRRSDSQVFKNWSIEDLDDQIPETSIPRLGADWGFAHDPNVLIEAFVWGRTLYIRREAYKVRSPIAEIASLFAGSDTRTPPRWENIHGHPGIPTSRQYPIVADSSRPETVRHLKDLGFNILSAKKGAGSIRDGIEFLQSYDIVVHPRNTHTIDELRRYSFKVDPHTDEVLNVLKDDHNHVIDALRYALESLRRRWRNRISLQAPRTVHLNSDLPTHTLEIA